MEKKRDVRKKMQRSWKQICILKNPAKKQVWLDCGGGVEQNGRLEATQDQLTGSLEVISSDWRKGTGCDRGFIRITLAA